MTTGSTAAAWMDESLGGKAWRWRGGNMALDASPFGLENDLVAQLVLSRGVPLEDLERHRTPSLRNFLPDPSHFRDMDAAAERLAQAVLTGEKVTVYGDYDVDGATSAALLMRLLRDAGARGGILHPRPPARRLWPLGRSAGAAGGRAAA
jgi:single-stranded-DNA-specific exonuclease